MDNGLFADEFENSSRDYYIFTPVTILSCAMTLLCAFVFSPLLLPIALPQYRANSREDKLTVNYLLAPIIHHFTVSMLSIYAIVSGTIANRLYSTSALGFALLQTTLGYLVGDLIVSILDERKHKNYTSVIAHHTVGISSMVLILNAQGIGLFFGVSQQISELSSIFFNIIIGLDAFRVPKSSFVYKTVGFLFILSFFVVRVMCIPWHWYEIVTMVLLNPHSNIIRFHLKVYSCFHHVFFDLLNLYWFSLIIKAMQNIKTKKET